MVGAERLEPLERAPLFERTPLLELLLGLLRLTRLLERGAETVPRLEEPERTDGA